MTAFQPFTIIVPGSTANFGPGFDSVGMAVNRYLTLSVTPADTWHFKPLSGELAGIPDDESNLIYTIAEWIAGEYGKTLPQGARIEMESTIPLSRGFGSSASAIVAGIELADQLLNLALTDEEKTRFASIREGHPDNVAPSVCGGLIIGSHRSDSTDIIKAGIPEASFIAVIPSYEVSTSSSRGTLPETMSHAEAVQASSVSNVLVAAILRNDWALAGKMMAEDHFHRPYRIAHIPEWKKAEDAAAGLPVHGVTLSGAGPIMLFVMPAGEEKEVLTALNQTFPDHAVEEVKPDRQGVRTVPLEAPQT
ncbi:homoserine kinase [Salisediminibacterium halotolerans]|uniref:Homoserine kinase n=1 Tax=Salisediminibacterium halotolerans TaxID=517425 RepID=A0A1H9W7N3_9BACI|nr:homoserine kinase [Salisediminibacterium haloalkalitolerans]SES29976.1 homoserine kinase [Salisediminibacterium haloalkalitolerans]